jgi:hypothetical protein
VTRVPAINVGALTPACSIIARSRLMDHLWLFVLLDGSACCSNLFSCSSVCASASMSPTLRRTLRPYLAPSHPAIAVTAAVAAGLRASRT